MKDLFPYKLHLQIFQLDEYNVVKFLKWIFTHYATREIENKKPLIWTKKAKSIFYVAILLACLTFVLLWYFYGFLGFSAAFFITTQSYLFVLLAYYLLLPIEIYQKHTIKRATEKKLDSLKDLQIIGVTGSYGKTSVKEFLYQILKTKYSVLKTPESYNTPYGIAKVVNLELDKSYEYFICEMGAYRIGEIKEICDMVHPTYGILTGINQQHLESFGSLENTTKGKFELIDALPKNGFGVVNIDNERIKNNLLTYNQKIITYGFSNSSFSMRNSKQTTHGTTFTLVLDHKEYHAKTQLLGKPNLQNILAAATMSYLLGMKPDAIIQAIATLKPVPHRLEIKQQDTMTIIDNAFNSNVDGFKESIALLKNFEQTKVLVTPGIVELGKQTFSTHKELGEQLDAIDYIFLIGNSERTRGLKAGIKNQEKIIELRSISEVWYEISKRHLNNPVVLIENDLPDNYQ